MKSTRGYHPGVDLLVEDFRRSRVRLLCVVGVDCELIEEMIDQIAVGDGTLGTWELTTTSHPGEPLVAVVAFANTFLSEGPVHVIEV